MNRNDCNDVMNDTGSARIDALVRRNLLQAKRHDASNGMDFAASMLSFARNLLLVLLASIPVMMFAFGLSEQAASVFFTHLLKGAAVFALFYSGMFAWCTWRESRAGRTIKAIDDALETMRTKAESETV